MSCVNGHKKTNQEFADYSKKIPITESHLGTANICILSEVELFLYVDSVSASVSDVEGTDIYQRRIFFYDNSWLQYESTMESIKIVNRVSTNSILFVTKQGYGVGTLMKEISPKDVDVVVDLEVISIKLKNENIYLELSEEDQNRIRKLPSEFSSIVEQIPNARITNLSVIPKCN